MAENVTPHYTRNRTLETLKIFLIPATLGRYSPTLIAAQAGGQGLIRPADRHSELGWSSKDAGRIARLPMGGSRAWHGQEKVGLSHEAPRDSPFAHTSPSLTVSRPRSPVRPSAMVLMQDCLGRSGGSSLRLTVR